MDGAIRRVLMVRGCVQGVGFRPFAHALATRLGVAGGVCNDAGVVRVEVEGERDVVDEYARRLARPPEPATVAEIVAVDVAPRGETVFAVAPSERTALGEPSPITRDLAHCDACRDELFDPRSRRHRYPFLACARCGPRFTVVREAPFDRARTTLDAFPLCVRCRAEHDDPADRRFCAQTMTCPTCGPRLRWLDADGRSLDGDPLDAAIAALRQGLIVAIKGVGGYHLACDATNESTVARLRERKRRAKKPFAVLVRDRAQADALCVLDEAERAALSSSARPIVLARPREHGLAPSIAPGVPTLGLLLPPSALHELLAAAAGVPLVLTSANVSDEPIAFRDDDAIARLGALADRFLAHDREIHAGTDDSVVRVIDGAPMVLRRSRGYAPAPLELPAPLAVPTLAVGGSLKATFALGAARAAFASHHLGDLDGWAAYEAFTAATRAYERLLGIAPRRVVHDLHPDYASTRWADEHASALGLDSIGVQHHHAHFAACLAEHRVAGPAIGVVFDGAGYGTDGTTWGGELLIGDAAAVTRVGHLSTIALAGGDRAAHEPWRVAVAHLMAAGLPIDRVAARVDRSRVRAIATLIERGVHAPVTSSAGRLFDAIAWLLGGPDVQAFEAQAALGLEALAARAASQSPYMASQAPRTPTEGLDARPLVRALVDDVDRGVDRAIIARRFHASLAAMIADACDALRAERGVATVALSGGVFQNALLAEETATRLRARSFHVLLHRAVPCNDAGLAFGQLAVLAARDGVA